MALAAVNIFRFFDCREFLIAALGNLKVTRKQSLRTIAKMAGLSPGFLPQVLAGQKNLSIDSAEKLIPIFGLNEAESGYFKILINLSLAPSQKKRIAQIRMLSRFSDFRSQNPQEIETFLYLSKWYNVAIRELADTKNFQENPKWIQKQLISHVTVTEIKKSLQFLEENKFLARNSSGRLTQSNKIINCQEGIFRLALGSFHLQMFEQATNSIDRVTRDRRSLSGYTLSIRRDNFSEICKIFEEAQTKLINLEKSKSDSEDVYHITFAAFPLTGRK